MGGIIIGGYVDKTKEFKRSTLVTLAVTFFLLFPLGLTEHQIGKGEIGREIHHGGGRQGTDIIHY